MAAEIIHPDRISNTFKELESRKILLTTYTDLYKSFTENFESLQRALDQRKRDLNSRIEAFESQKEETLKYLEERENSVSERETAAVARVEEIRQAATSELENEINKDGTTRDLKSCCRKMDVKRFMKLLVLKRKESVQVKTETAQAIEDAVDVHRFSLDSVEEFVNAKYAKGGGAADKRWASSMLMEAVFPISELGSGKKMVASSIRSRAAEIAERWRGLMGSEGEVGTRAGEAAVFLHVLCGFGIKDGFDEDFLRKLVVEHAEKKDMAKLAMALGLREKMGGIIEELIKNGNEIEAVYFVFESGLTELFPPIEMLKSYVRNSKKTVNDILKKGHSGAIATEEAASLELNSCKAIVRCVEEFKLEEKFPIENLKRRVTQLEKAKTEKKKTGFSTGKHLQKRGRGMSGKDAGNAAASRPSKAARYPAHSSSLPQKSVPLPQHQTPLPRYSTQYSYQSYEGPGSVVYGSGGYGATHTQASATLAQKYQYPSQDSGAGGARALGSYGVQAYGAYDYGSAATSAGIPSQTYPPLYPQ